jgi:hypothetical protein
MKRSNSFPRIAQRTLWALTLVLPSVAAAQTTYEVKPFLPQLITSSTIPGNGDLNPYGVAFVPVGFPAGGLLHPGDVLVSNFNNNNNLQGLGTTIIQFTPTSGAVAPQVPIGSNGNAVTFFPSSLNGLTTALGVLQRGFVVVGNLPTTDGSFGSIGQGALQVVNSNGQTVQTLTDAKLLDSPWDLTIVDGGAQAIIFVSNVKSGTVSRIDVAVGSSNVKVLSITQIAIGYTSQANSAALILGPTGLAFDPLADMLYVASTADNTIFAIPHAAEATAPVTKGNPVFSGQQLRGPLALVFAPNGNLLTANGDAVNADPTHPSEIVEFTKAGKFVREFNVDASQGGAFGIATVLSPLHSFNFAAVDDVPNDISVYVLPPHIPNLY